MSFEFNVQAYRRRIGLPERISKSGYELLKEMQLAHVLTVPYENLDIISGVPLRLDEENLYKKVVLRNRGGYCFELNCLFSHLLNAVGFNTENYFARYLRGCDDGEVPIKRHRIVCAQADGERYICDVGVGQQAPRLPLLLKEDTVQEQFEEKYVFRREPMLGWVLWDWHKDGWRRFFSFTEENCLDIDFTAASYYCEKHPESVFNKQDMVSIKTSDGRKTLDGDNFKIFCGHELVYLKALEQREKKGILKKEFSIEI